VGCCVAQTRSYGSRVRSLWSSDNKGPSDPKPMHLPLTVSTLITVNESCLGEFIKTQVIIRDLELVAVEGPKNLHSY